MSKQDTRVGTWNVVDTHPIIKPVCCAPPKREAWLRRAGLIVEGNHGHITRIGRKNIASFPVRAVVFKDKLATPDEHIATALVPAVDKKAIIRTIIIMGS